VNAQISWPDGAPTEIELTDCGSHIRLVCGGLTISLTIEPEQAHKLSAWLDDYAAAQVARKEPCP